MKRKRNSKSNSNSTSKKARVESDSFDYNEITTVTEIHSTPTKKTNASQHAARVTPEVNGVASHILTNGTDSPTSLKRSKPSTPGKRRADKDVGLSNVTPAKKRSPAKVVTRGTPQSKRGLRFESIEPNNVIVTPQKSAKPSTPSKKRAKKLEEQVETSPLLVRNADRSARRKVTRKLIERNVRGIQSESEEAESEEDELGNIILNGDGEIEEEDVDDGDGDNELEGREEQIPDATNTPVKRGRGRPKGSKNKNSSMPVPEDLEPHELYFYQTRPGGTKTSNNTFPSHLLLTHEDYFAILKKYEDSHKAEREFLHSLHSASFDQWKFELENGFSVCLYGYGSKRELAMDFANHLYRESEKPPTIFVVNGYNSTLTLRCILTNLANAITTPKEKKSSGATSSSSTTTFATPIPTQPAALVNYILSHLPQPSPSSSSTPNSKTQPVTLIIHSIDAIALRRTPSTQSHLATLAQHPSIHLLATADTPNFPLLWDTSTSAKFSFVYHDATTFAPFGPEIDAVDAVNELLGRRSRRMGGRDGVAFVLRSLPENARALFRILLVEQIGAAGLEEEGVRGGGRKAANEAEYDDNNDNNAQAGNGLFAHAMHINDDPFAPTNDNGGGRSGGNKSARSKRKSHGNRGNSTTKDTERGTEYRVLYHKAVENFVCSSEMAFRTLLKEFHDHAIVEAHRDGSGVERLWIPFRKDELEMLLAEMDAA